MADYKNMTAIEALREAKDASGMTAESIAQGVGITATHLRRYLDPNDNYAPSLHIIPAFVQGDAEYNPPPVCLKRSL